MVDVVADADVSIGATTMPGEFITCPDCQGWLPNETGWLCQTCEGDGQIWKDYEDIEEGFDAGEWNNVPAPDSSRATENKGD